jgi:hypothetical protein
MLKLDTVKMALPDLIFIILTLVIIIFILIHLYLALGLLSPELNISIDRKIRKVLKKPAIIILDPWYIRKRNIKWILWLNILFFITAFLIIFILKSIA